MYGCCIWRCLSECSKRKWLWGGGERETQVCVADICACVKERETSVCVGERHTHVCVWERETHMCGRHTGHTYHVCMCGRETHTQDTSVRQKYTLEFGASSPCSIFISSVCEKTKYFFIFFIRIRREQPMPSIHILCGREDQIKTQNNGTIMF